MAEVSIGLTKIERIRAGIMKNSVSGENNVRTMNKMTVRTK